ncbi:phosphotransferase family protein [Gemelliphila palaticanis]|uniref:Phosphotransferase family protein n=1 Tax=Gemelliphila palaticanis TaxID=81950 RepID=A0ABX2T198_9BACL|nr:phosphotransferase family protein [Gemella palaticanis]MBF0716026.1 phosphotransferase family protein [Gemella palaticanis]NYS47956.1 phosphotransferase family protein [Gemella palaticanis]
MQKEYYQMGWTLGTDQSEEYYFSKNDNRYFIKENSSPIIATLSAENIVPKLKWTKRLSSGKVITAQDFENGKTLTKEQMLDSRIPKILKKVHNSEKIKKIMISQGYEERTPEQLFSNLKKIISDELLRNSDIAMALNYLEKNIPKFSAKVCTPCHTDVHKDNWLLSDSNKLFLVDWEEAFLGDSAIDVSFILYKYIPQENWQEWLNSYGAILDLPYRLKLKWYITLQSLIMVVWYKEKQQFSNMNEWLIFIKKIFTEYI